MTRKDYELIAESIKSAREGHHQGDAGELALNVAVEHLSDALKADDPNFDRGLFSEATRRESA